MKAIFSQFADLLDVRFRKEIYTSEDAVRYTMFASMLYQGIPSDSLSFEYPHPTLDGAKIDTWFQIDGEKPIAIEFKYDRVIPSGRNQPRTQKAGSVFHDLYRLLLVNTSIRATCYFVYVTTSEMATYFTNPSNGHNAFFELLPGASIEIQSDYFSGKPQTFRKQLGNEFEARIKGVLSRSLAADHSLRIFEVETL